MVGTRANIISQLEKQILHLLRFRPASLDSNDGGLALIKEAFPHETFPVGAIHEFISLAQEESAAAFGFIAGVVASLMKFGAPAIWVSSLASIFPPSLHLFGIDPAKVIFIHPKKSKDVLWTLEEALKCASISSVIGEIGDISLIESRRLQLAVEESKVTGFLLRRHPKNLTTSFVTRWRIKPLHSQGEHGMPGLGFPKWSVELMKVKNGKPGAWQMVWRNGRFNLVLPGRLIAEEQERKIV